MSRLRARTYVAHDADNLLQRRRRRAHAEYRFDLEPLLVDGEVAVARDNDEPVDVTLQERLVPVRIAIVLLLVAEVRHCVLLLSELEGSIAPFLPAGRRELSSIPSYLQKKLNSRNKHTILFAE